MKNRAIVIAALTSAFALLCVSQVLNAPPATPPARKSSLELFRRGEQLMRDHDYQSAALSFGEALNGDAQPAWTVVWSHIDLGLVFDSTGQRDRAKAEFQHAIDTKDDTLGAQGIAQGGLLAPALQPDLTPLPQDADAYAQPNILTKSEPQYTQEALLARLEGTVVVEASLDSDGRVVDARPKGWLGLGLDEAAVDSIRHWTFAPATRKGLPVADVADVEVSFRLPGVPGWHVKKIDFVPPAETARPVFTRGTSYMPDKMPPDLAEEANIDKATGRIPGASVSMDIDAAGAPANIKVTSASLPEWGDDAVRAIGEWRFTAGSGVTPCTIELVWYPAKQP